MKPPAQGPREQRPGTDTPPRAGAGAHGLRLVVPEAEAAHYPEMPWIAARVGTQPLGRSAPALFAPFAGVVREIERRLSAEELELDDRHAPVWHRSPRPLLRAAVAIENLSAALPASSEARRVSDNSHTGAVSLLGQLRSRAAAHPRRTAAMLSGLLGPEAILRPGEAPAGH